MDNIPQRLRELRKESKLTQAEVADFLNISESAYGYYEQGRNDISTSSVKKLAKKYNVSVAYIMGESNTKDPQNEKDEKDIAKRMAIISDDLQNAIGLSFDGEPISDEARESLLEAMEFGVRLAKKANKKYIPKKYRDEE